MAPTDPGAHAVATPTAPVLLAYDGSDLAAVAVDDAGRQCAAGRDALVLCVFQPSDIGFTPTGQQHFDAASAAEVRTAAEETAAYGATLAEKAGFHAQSLAIESAPIWQGIIETAQEHHVSLIVLGSHRRSGLAGHLLGSVAAAVTAHSRFPVLIVPQAS